MSFDSSDESREGGGGVRTPTAAWNIFNVKCVAEMHALAK